MRIFQQIHNKMKLIEHIQARIEALYGIRIGAYVGDYLIEENDLTTLMPVNQQTVLPKELFLVNPNPEEETLEVALFLNKKLLNNLLENNPMENLSKNNISDFCALIEGISHFVYYLHKASLKYEVTQLELELQAEIDKFLLLSLLTEGVEGEEVNNSFILDLLFEDYCLNNELSEAEKERYTTANTLARKFCSKLSTEIKQNRLEELLKKIRQFYPLTQEEKIRQILC